MLCSRGSTEFSPSSELAAVSMREITTMYAVTGPFILGSKCGWSYRNTMLPMTKTAAAPMAV